ncbi:MAG: acyl-CoA desaturase [Herpetosiphon sp.]
MNSVPSIPSTRPSQSASSRAIPMQGSYADLKQQVQQAGLLDKRPGYLVLKIVFNLVLFAMSIGILFSTRLLAVQLLNAVFMAFVSVQISFIIHDTGHRQAFQRTRTNDFVGMLHGNLLYGGSFAWWVDVHNQHHANPNSLESDPHIDLPLFAFSPEEAESKRGLLRWLIKYQAYYIFPLMVFTLASQSIDSWRYLRSHQWKYRSLEIGLWITHVVVYVAMVIVALGVPTAIVFMLVHRGLTGLYAGSIFAPNHKGMPLIEAGAEIDFLHQQVLTARNVSGGWLVDFWYGGLNFQIEHHLFPALPRQNLRAAQQIVRRFCATNGIPYYETGMYRSYVEIVQALHEASSPLREPIPVIA